ncbi:MAG: hypothetical protein C4324_11935 [Blastocatellia bacterium]
MKCLVFSALVLLSTVAVFSQQPVQPQPTPIRPGAVLPQDLPPVAPDFKASARPLPSMDRVGVEADRQMALSLEDAIEFALKNSNDIDASRSDVKIAEWNLRAARAAFDPVFEFQNLYESTETPVASLIGGAVNGSVTQTRLFGSAGVAGSSPIFGGVYSARFDSSRTTTSNTNSFLNPQFPSLLTFSYTQPLFRGRGFDGNRRSIEIAKKNLSLSDSQFRQRAIEVISSVEQAYWDLTFALRSLQVQIEAVKQARLQLESNRRQVEKGILPPIDLVAAEAQIANFEQRVYLAQEVVTRAENALKILILPDRTAADWSKAIVPVSPVNLDPPSPKLEDAVAEALRLRPEVTQLEAAKEINDIEKRYFRNRLKPQIDFTASYTAQGLAGTVTRNGQGRVPPTFIGGYLTSLGNVFGLNFPSYRFGVTVSLPFGNRAAEAEFGRVLVQESKIQSQVAQTGQTIEAEVRNALQTLKSAEARLSAAAAERIAAEQLFESEMRQFRVGTTTFYLVQQRQTDLLNARSRELQAQTDLNKAISGYHRAVGSTLEVNSVNVSSGGSILRLSSLRNSARVRFSPAKK